MIPGSGLVSLKGQPVRARGIDNMNHRPSVRSISDVAGDALFAGDLSQLADKALFHRVMNLRETHDGHFDTTLQGGRCCYFGCLSRVEGVGIKEVLQLLIDLVLPRPYPQPK
jgi:hypothetical protein